MVAASLKRRLPTAWAGLTAAFPRLNGRGLIEARRSRRRHDRRATFPRLNGRGLIEARDSGAGHQFEIDFRD